MALAMQKRNNVSSLNQKLILRDHCLPFSPLYFRFDCRPKWIVCCTWEIYHTKLLRTKCTIYLGNMVRFVKFGCKYHSVHQSQIPIFLISIIFLTMSVYWFLFLFFLAEETHRRPEERHLLCTRIYSMRKMLAIIYRVSTFVIVIWLCSTTNRTRHSSVWTWTRNKKNWITSKANTTLAPTKLVNKYPSFIFLWHNF